MGKKLQKTFAAIMAFILSITVLSASAWAYDGGGIENREWEEMIRPGDTVPDITVILKPGEITVGTAVQTATDIIGDVQQGPDDKTYDQTTTTTTVERSVKAETTGGEVTMEKVDTDLTSIREEHYAGKDPNVIGPDLDFVADTADTIPKPLEEGYDYQLVGFGDATNELKVLRDYITYQKEDGVPVKDEDGNFIIEKIETKLDNTPMQIALRKDENGEYEYFFGYCIDADTQTQDGAWYRVSNLEDNTYYPDQDSAAKLRAIVTNGYWGTQSGTGSLAQIKTLLKEACGTDAVVTVDTDENGGKAVYKITDIIDGLTEAEALAATQAAIWCFANGDTNTRDGQDGYIAYGPVNVYKPNPERNYYEREYLPQSDARAMAVFNWLCGLAPVANTNQGVTTVINEKNAFGNLSLTVHGKAQNHAENMDENADNDVYNSEVTFTLAFVPDPEKDDLLVYLLDQEGSPINDQNGEPVVRRLAGKNSEGRTADTILPDENNVYTLSGLQLQENADFRFDLHLEGAQYLQENVYIYTAHGGSDRSQSIVGIAEGLHTVDACVGLSVRFTVDENKHVSVQRSWHTQNETGNTPSVPSVIPPAALVPPVKEPVTGETVIVVPPPRTGDVSCAWMTIVMIGVMGLAAAFLLERKGGKME